MKSTIPIRSPVSTLEVCFPWKVASRATSRHHWTIVNKIRAAPSLTRTSSYRCNHEASPATKQNLPTDPVNGQGLKSTI